MPDKLTLEQFGQKIKAKYPGSYDDMADADVGQKVLAKYPQYGDMVAPSGPSNADVLKQKIETLKSNVAKYPKPSMLDTVTQVADAMPGSTLGDNIQGTVGMFKGAAKSGIGLVNMLVKNRKDPNKKFIEVPDSLQATNPRQQVGETAEQMAEFMIPGGAITRGGKALDTALAARKLSPAAAKVLSVLGRSGMEAASAGTIAEMQGGDAKTAAAFGAAGPVVGAAAGKLAEALEPAGNYLARREINSIIRPPQKAFRYGNNPGRTVAEEGITANSKNGLLDKIIQRRDEVGKEIETVLTAPSNAAKKVNIQPIVDEEINKAMLEAAKTGDQALVDKLTSLKRGLVNDFVVGADGQLQVVGQKNLQAMSPMDATLLKRAIADGTDFGTDASKVVNQTRKALYARIADEVEKAVPEVGKKNKTWGGLFTAGKALQNRIGVAERNNIGSFSDMVLGGLAGGAGLMHGGSPEAIAAASAAVAANKVAGSAAVKTRLAKMLAQQPSGSAMEVVGDAMRLGAGAKSQR